LAIFGGAFTIGYSALGEVAQLVEEQSAQRLGRHRFSPEVGAGRVAACDLL
jgi:hypothetical protein